VKQRILILVGLPGSGKSTASSFFHQKHISVVRMGDVTDVLLAEQGLQINEENESEMRDQLRNVYGEDVYARRTGEIVKGMTSEDLIVIEGMRSEAELNVFRTYFTDLKVIFIDTKDTVRYDRLLHRSVRPLTNEEAAQRDEWEKHTVDTTRLKKYADCIIKNDSTKEEFFKQLEKFLS
jgi:dephospho-CoA kinase